VKSEEGEQHDFGHGSETRKWDEWCWWVL